MSRQPHPAGAALGARRPTLARAVAALVITAACCAGAGCGENTIDVNTGPGGPGGPADDLGDGLGGGGPADLTGVKPPPPTPCGDTDPACMDHPIGPGGASPDGGAGSGPAFPLGSDPMRDPAEKDDGVSRDPHGWLALDSTHAAFDFLWIANSEEWGRGTVSKLDSRALREVARYLSVTCNSLSSTGSKARCDGQNGCCAADDHGRFTARQGQQPEPPHQAVNLMANNPSRTAIDFNGDMFVANRAFGGQSSVTKVANDVAECLDRNGNGTIDTSRDQNGDGLIQTDCNENGVPDDLADVKALPCTNKLAQEFFGLDDECVLWTTNTNQPDRWGRPLALGAGNVDYGPSDAWAGTYKDGRFFRLDGKSGLTVATAQGPQNAYGATVDADGVVWVAVIDDGRLGYFDTTTPSLTGRVRAPAFDLNAYGITMDRDQNVWQGGWSNVHAYRYVPDRSNGFANLGNGTWTEFQHPGDDSGATGNSRGIAADSRTAAGFYVWVARDGGWLVRLEPAKFPPMKVDQQVDASSSLAFRVAGSNTIGVGVDVQQNIWGVSQTGSVATRALVDAMGNVTPPNIKAAPAPGTRCPAGDRCPLANTDKTQPLPYTYSDFTGFGLRNFTRPKGSYSYVVPGCQGASRDTQWFAITWEADVPALTSLTVHARTGKTAVPDGTWGPFTAEFAASPASLRTPGVLTPFDKDDYYLQVEFLFATHDRNSTPRLKSLDVAFKCGNIM